MVEAGTDMDLGARPPECGRAFCWGGFPPNPPYCSHPVTPTVAWW
jgi:hypothetical protein